MPGVPNYFPKVTVGRFEDARPAAPLECRRLAANGGSGCLSAGNHFIHLGNARHVPRAQRIGRGAPIRIATGNAIKRCAIQQRNGQRRELEENGRGGTPVSNPAKHRFVEMRRCREIRGRQRHKRHLSMHWETRPRTNQPSRDAFGARAVRGENLYLAASAGLAKSLSSSSSPCLISFTVILNPPGPASTLMEKGTFTPSTSR